MKTDPGLCSYEAIFTNRNVLVIGPGIYPVYRRAPLVPVLFVPEQQGHPVPRVFGVADVAGQQGGVGVLVGDVLDLGHQVAPGGDGGDGPQHNEQHESAEHVLTSAGET